MSSYTGGVSAYVRIDDGAGGLTGPLDSGPMSDYFGISVASLGDLNGDGVADLAVGARRDDDGGDGYSRGAVYIVFLNADGTVKAETKISSTQGGLTGPLDAHDNFGSSLASLGDLDGDGVADLAVGINGAVYILFLNADGTVKDEIKLSASTVRRAPLCPRLAAGMYTKLHPCLPDEMGCA